MKRLRYSLLAAAGILVLAFVLTAVGPRRVMAALGYTPVRDVDQPALQPFAHSADLRFLNGNVATDSIRVPLGERLVIESISTRAFVSPGTAVDFELETTTGGDFATVYPVAKDVGNFFGLDRREATESIHLYADPGSVVEFIAQKNDSTVVGGGDVSISGHFVKLP